LEIFYGKTAKASRQDFHAKVFLLTLCAAYAHPIEEKVIQEYKADEQRKHDQRINRTNALVSTQDILISMFIRKHYQKAREIIRPGRNDPRRTKPKSFTQ
jgi:hypothetical protein